jgi:hypothetical protein
VNASPTTKTTKAPAGELDLPLKLAMRRVFWGMNYATRINLKLALPGDRRTSDELSDVDCVAFSTGADFSVRLLIADCKSGGRVSPAARAFWLAGVRDFFGADRAYLVLAREIPKGVREMAGRLDLDILGAADRQILENVHGPHSPAAPFFEVEGITRLQQLATGMDKGLQALVGFREHDFWTLPEERRLQRLIVELRKAAPKLDCKQKAHQLLVVDLLFLFALALLGACRFVSAVSLADPREALLVYLLGGPEQTRSRRQQLRDLDGALGALGKSVDVPKDVLAALKLEPAYFDELAETVTRFLRRPRDAQRVLRYLEWWAQAQVGLDAPPVVTALGPSYGDYTRKLAADLARTCFAAAGLGRDWMKIATAAGDGIGAEATAATDESHAGESAPEVDPVAKAETESGTGADAAQLRLP